MKDTLKGLINSGNNISATDLVKLFDVKIDVLEKAMNLPDGTFATSGNTFSTENQNQLKNMILIIESASKHSENYSQAFKWYTDEKLPSFGGCTASELVISGMTHAVVQYLERISLGGYT